MEYLKIDANTIAVYKDQPESVIYLDKLQDEITALQAHVASLPTSLTDKIKDEKRADTEDEITIEESQMVSNKNIVQKTLDEKIILLNRLLGL